MGRRLDDLDLEQIRHGILESDPATRKTQKRSILPKLRMSCELIKSGVQRTCSQFRLDYRRRYLQIVAGPPFTIKTEHYWAVVTQVGAAVAMVLDTLVSAVLSKNWLNLPPMAAIIAGGSIGVFLSFLCKAGVGIVAKAVNTQDPRNARRRLEVMGTLAFIANVILIVIVLLGRTPSRGFVDFILSLSGAVIGVLGITLPVLAGALLALSHDLDWSYRFESDFQNAKLQFADILSLRAWCGEDVSRETTTDVEERTREELAEDEEAEEAVSAQEGEGEPQITRANATQLSLHNTGEASKQPSGAGGE